jgi:hypothetical protein
MADRIQSYYSKAGEMGGIEARAKLSMLTMVNSHQAGIIPDSDDNIRLFEKAMSKIVKEFNTEESTGEMRLKLLRLLMK